jgi:hypothetical protein
MELLSFSKLILWNSKWIFRFPWVWHRVDFSVTLCFTLDRNRILKPSFDSFYSVLFSRCIKSRIVNSVDYSVSTDKWCIDYTNSVTAHCCQHPRGGEKRKHSHTLMFLWVQIIAVNIVTCTLRVNSASVCLQPLLGNRHDSTIGVFFGVCSGNDVMQQ